MLTDAERAFRRTHMCSSDIAKAARIGRFGSPQEVWEDKVLGLDMIPNERLEIGHLLEPIAADLYSRRTQRKLRPSTTLEHPRHHWAGATPDRLVEGEQRLLEVKVVGMNSAPFWGEPGTDEIPDHYRAQVEWQLEVLGWQHADVAALIGTELRIYHVDRDPQLAAELVEAGRQFWFRYVLPEIPPPVDGSEGCSEYLERRFPRAKARPELAPMSAVAAAALLEYRDADAAIGDAEARKKEAGNRLRLAIGEAGVEGLEDELLGRVTWKQTASGGTDWHGVAEELRTDLGFAMEQLRQVAPELVARLREPGESWSILLDKFRRPGSARLDQRPPKKPAKRITAAQVREAIASLGPRPDFSKLPPKPKTQLTLVQETRR